MSLFWEGGRRRVRSGTSAMGSALGPASTEGGREGGVTHARTPAGAPSSGGGGPTFLGTAGSVFRPSRRRHEKSEARAWMAEERKVPLLLPSPKVSLGGGGALDVIDVGNILFAWIWRGQDFYHYFYRFLSCLTEWIMRITKTQTPWSTQISRTAPAVGSFLRN